MKKELNKFPTYLILLVVVAIGISIVVALYRYILLVDAITGFAVLFFAYRLYISPRVTDPERNDLMFNFHFPELIKDFISYLLFSIVVGLAFYRVLYAFLVLIRLFH